MLFTFPSRYLFAIGDKGYLALGDGPPRFPQGSSCPVVLGCQTGHRSFRLQDSHPLRWAFPGPSTKSFGSVMSGPATPHSKLHGLGSCPFARRYLGNRYYFLFVRLLRCFSSPAALYPAYRFSRECHGYSPQRVTPFGNPRIKARLQLPEAYRRLPRPSSALCPKASTARPS